MSSTSFQPDERELKLACWIHALSAKGAAEIFLRFFGELLDEWAATPRWRLLKRRQILRTADSAKRLYEISDQYAREQSP